MNYDKKTKVKNNRIREFINIPLFQLFFRPVIRKTTKKTFNAPTRQNVHSETIPVVGVRSRIISKNVVHRRRKK